jgi:hypothetical protein
LANSWDATCRAYKASAGRPSHKFADRVLLALLVIFAVIASSYITMLVGVVDSDTLNVVSAAMVIPMLPLVWLAFVLQQRDKRHLRRIAAKQNYFVVACPLVIAALTSKVTLLAIRPAAKPLPLPRITDVNLTPRLLPIPRAYMGAAI